MVSQNHSQTDAALKLILESQIQKSDLAQCWIDGYKNGINNKHTEPKDIPNNYIDSIDIEFWIQGWYAGFNKEPIIFYNKSDFDPLKLIRIPKNKINKINKNKSDDKICCLV